MLAWIVSGEFYLHTQCSLHFSVGSFSYTSHAGFIFYLRLHFYVGSFSYTSRAGFNFIWGVCLTQPVMDYFFIIFYLGSFSYTSRAGFMFMWEVSLTHPEFWGVAFTHPILVSLLCGEFLLHIPCWFHFYVGSFSYTSRACFLFIWRVSLTHPTLVLLLLSGASFLCGEFLLHIPCWLHFNLGCFSYTARAGLLFLFYFIYLSGSFLLHIPCSLHVYVGSFSYKSRVLGSLFYASNAGFTFMWGVSLTHPVLVSFLCGEFLLHIPCLLPFYLGSFSYTSHAGFIIFIWGFIFMWGVSLTHPVLASFLYREFFFHSPWWITVLFGEFLLHIPYWLHVYVRSFSYTSRVLGSFFYASNAGFSFIWGVSFTHPVLVSFSCGEFLLHTPVLASFLTGEFLLHIPSFLYISFGSSLTHPVLDLYFFWGNFSYTSHSEFIFLSGQFLLHVPCWLLLFLNLESFSYTSHGGLNCIWGVLLTHPVLASFFCREFLLHIPCWLYFYLGLHFYVGSFSYTSRAGFMFMWGVSLTHPEFWGVSFTHPMLFHFYVGSFSYTSRAGFIFVWGVSLTHPVLASFLSGEFLLHIPCWLHLIFLSRASILCGEFLLHIPCWLHSYLGSFSYTARVFFFF